VQPVTERGTLARLAPVLLPLMSMPSPAARLTRVIPGLHW